MSLLEKLKLPNCKEVFIPDNSRMGFANGDYCLTGEHEVLTEIGWVRLDTFVEKRMGRLACWNNYGGSITFQEPKDYIKINYEGELYNYTGKVDILGSPNHKQPMLSTYKVFRPTLLKDLYTSKGGLNYIHSGYTKETNSVDTRYLQLLVAMQADGCFVKENSSYIRFSFSKQRKIIRLTALLFDMGIPFKVKETLSGYTNIYIQSKEEATKKLLFDLGREKNFPTYLYNLDYTCLSIFINELQYWDGKQEKLDNFSYFTTNRYNADLVQGICSLVNKYASLTVEVSSRNPLATKDMYSLYISDKVYSQHRTTARSKLAYKGNLYCVTVPTGYFVVRHNNKVCITGNSGADAMVVAYDSDCEWLINFFATSKEKLYVYMAREYLQKDITEKDPWYKRFKMYCHLTNYGGKELKAAQSCGMSVFEARRIRQWYFGLCPEIPEWHTRIESTIKARRPITNIFGAEAWYLNLDDPTVLNQAYAWIPQSTIGILVNKGWYNIRSKEGWTYVKKLKTREDIGSVKLQVHDALLVQYPRTDLTAPDRIKDHMEIILPYPKPLKVPVDLKLSTISYGDCH